MKLLLALFAFALMVFEGDSRTFQNSWTFSVASKFSQSSAVVATNGARFTTFELRENKIDTLMGEGRNALIVWGGVNATKDNKDAQTIHAEMKSYCHDRREAGWFVIVFTEISADPIIKKNWDVIQPELNDLIRNNWKEYANLMVDLGARQELSEYRNTIYFVDGVHLTEEGNRVVAQTVIKRINLFITTNLIGALTAVIFLISAILVFVFRLLNKPEVGTWMGYVQFVLAVPLLYLLYQAWRMGRPRLYVIQILCVLLWLLVEALLDYIFKVDFRQKRAIVIPYVMLFFAACGGMVGIAANAGHVWTIISGVLFMITAMLAFVQRKVTGM